MTQTSGNLERLLCNERQVRKEKGWGIILVLSGPEGSWAGEAMSFYMLCDCLGPYITASRRKTSVLSEYAVVHSVFFLFFFFPGSIVLHESCSVPCSSRDVWRDEPFPQGWHIQVNVLGARARCWGLDFDQNVLNFRGVTSSISAY